MRFKRNKYRVSPKADRTWNGRVYASKAEMEYAKLLDIEMRGGLWKSIVPQPRLSLGPIDYVPDFAVEDHNGRWRWIDVKGMETPEFKLKKKLWPEYGRGDLVIVKKSGKRFKVTETIEGKRELTIEEVQHGT